MSPNPFIDEKKLLKMKRLLERPRSIAVLMDLLMMSRRTVYRYLTKLEEDGESVGRVGISRPTKYQIR